METAADHVEPGSGHEEAQRAPFWLRIAALALVIAISAAVVVWGKQLSSAQAYSYPALFLLHLIANATIFLPAPALIADAAAGSVFPPLLVGLAGGSGGALGELTGYLAGWSGSGVIENDPRYARMRGWMERWGLWVVFVLSLIPNPLFDAAGLLAGALRLPVRRFLLACWAGNVLKAIGAAYLGGQAVGLFQQLIGH